MRPPPADLAIVFGSGLAVVPDGAEVLDEIAYADLGWPTTAVAGHANRGRRWLVDGRMSIDDLADRGLRGLLLTNASGALDTTLAAGTAVVVTQVVDLQVEPAGAPPVLPVTGGGAAPVLSRVSSSGDVSFSRSWKSMRSRTPHW